VSVPFGAAPAVSAGIRVPPSERQFTGRPSPPALRPDRQYAALDVERTRRTLSHVVLILTFAVAVVASLVTTRISALHANEAEAVHLADELEELWTGPNRPRADGVAALSSSHMSRYGKRALDATTVLSWGTAGQRRPQLWAAIEDDTGRLLARLVRSPSRVSAPMRLRSLWRVSLSAFMVAWIAFWGGVLLLNRVVDRLEKAQSAVLDAARRDPLTGLMNRQGFEHLVRREVAGGPRGWIFVIDIFRFRELNDAAGPAQGDAVLMQMADRLRGVLGPDDLASRIGADVFSVWSPALATDADAEQLGREIEAVLSAPYPLAGAKITRRIHVGMCAVATTGDEFACLARAEAAMRAGRENQVPILAWTADVADQQQDAVHLIAALEAALTTQSLDVHYQPIRDLRTNRWASMEALVRWEHPDRGFVSPAVFIPLAETHGLINGITEFVVTHAARTLQRVHASGETSMMVAINLAALSLVDMGLPARLAGLVRDCGIDPSSVHLEITETSTFGDREATLAALAKLSDLGFSIYLDDFGTGTSSLSHLRELPIDGIKIDRSFVMEATLDGNNHDAAIVEATIQLAHSLGLTVVGEGVETDEMLQMLAGFQCDYAQGFGLQRPVPRDQLLAMFEG
jgi:diguanylate cyclase (GGDEF)-like protein